MAFIFQYRPQRFSKSLDVFPRHYINNIIHAFLQFRVDDYADEFVASLYFVFVWIKVFRLHLLFYIRSIFFIVIPVARPTFFLGFFICPHILEGRQGFHIINASAIRLAQAVRTFTLHGPSKIIRHFLNMINMTY